MIFGRNRIVFVEEAGNTRSHETCNVAGNHCTETDLGQLMTLIGSQWREATDLNPDTREIGKSGSRVTGNVKRSVRDYTLKGSQLVVGDKLREETGSSERLENKYKSN